MCRLLLRQALFEAGRAELSSTILHLDGQVWNTVLDVLFPYIGRKYRECRFRAKVERAEESGLTEGRRGRRLLRHARSQAWAESRLSEYDTFNEYAKMRA